MVAFGVAAGLAMYAATAKADPKVIYYNGHKGGQKHVHKHHHGKGHKVGPHRSYRKGFEHGYRKGVKHGHKHAKKHRYGHGHKHKHAYKRPYHRGAKHYGYSGHGFGFFYGIPGPHYWKPAHPRPFRGYRKVRARCHPVSRFGHDRYGRRAKLGATKCYDKFGHGYIVRGSRHVIHYY